MTNGHGESVKSFNVENMSFPLKVVVGLIAGCLGIYGSVNLSTNSLKDNIKDVDKNVSAVKSDVTSIKEKQELRDQLDIERNANITRQLGDATRLANMANENVRELQLQLARKGILK